MLRWLLNRFGAQAQGDDVDRLAVEGDPRGGLQAPEYRHADPRDLVEDGDVAMSGPGGAPQDGTSAEERQAGDRADPAAPDGPSTPSS